ncbi:VC_2705 family sodium/solute symporter [Thermodesulfovibrio sp. 1176]|uniref:VC_2705 family sodium/solute symporter n=1 Tax=Thermodesulfovibrio sp. 1176 TaxID=3043424 RepID=UPI0024823A5B|nr:VC_2705 family sodium/solute symporter [Thermodesulfovibrio sp. 1176]MDI1472623.1 VC_2705 family sodium/solute symporter [Thermodesulfovibrio sp. 1176]
MNLSSPINATIIATICWILCSVIITIIGGEFLGSLIIVIGSIFIYLVLAVTLRSTSVAHFYVAGREIPAVVNGAATAADWMSAASYLSMAGAIALMGYDALPFVIGWTLGYTLMAFTIAPFVRKSKTYTVPELLEKRAGGWGPVRTTAVIMIFVMSLTYLTAQLVGVGVVFSRFLGLPATVAVFIGVFGALAYAWTSGWRSITWVQFLQYFVMITMYCTPVFIAAYFLGLLPFPQLQYGNLIQEIEMREMAFNLPLITEPFVRSIGGGQGPINWIFFALVLMLGTMGLPHILVRFYTVKTVHAARVSVGWALTFIGLLYITASVYAAIARHSFSALWGKPFAEVMSTDWIQKWLPTGLIKLSDKNADGILQPAELVFHGDIVVVGMPDMFGMLWVIAPLVAVGGLAAALSTADGLLLAMSTAITRDVYKRFINPQATEHREILIVRLLLVIIGFIGAVMAYFALKDPGFGVYVVLLVGWAFVFAASTFTPIIILSIFWKRLNRYGMIAGMITGLLIALPYIILVGIAKLPPIELFGDKIGTIGWGIFGFFGNAIAAILVSLLTKPEGPEVDKFVESMRLPD